MRRRALRMTLWAVTVAVLLLGVPMAIFGSTMLWNQERSGLESRAYSLGSVIDRRINAGEPVTGELLTGWSKADEHIGYSVRTPDGKEFTSGAELTGSTLRATHRTAGGALILAERSRAGVYASIASFLALVGVAAAIAFLVGGFVAARQARRLSAPLIYLAASAEQVGAGHVRPHMRTSGIEEIDLVADELARTADRMAGRIAAERQFAADASHQLRTPLTALSMRLEEIELIADDEEVAEEARACQEQVERLTGVVEDLLKTSRSQSGGTTEAVHLAPVLAQQREEWAKVFAKERRELIIEDAEYTLLATPGSLSQIIATLLENSLKYGDGTTTVKARPTNNKKGVVIEVADEGPGVADSIAPDIFNKHVSTGGSTGLGLALAMDLAQADGGRLELAQRRPPIFALTLAAVPRSLDPDNVLPQGTLISLGSRRKRR